MGGGPGAAVVSGVEAVPENGWAQPCMCARLRSQPACIAGQHAKQQNTHVRAGCPPPNPARSAHAPALMSSCTNSPSNFFRMSKMGTWGGVGEGVCVARRECVHVVMLWLLLVMCSCHHAWCR